MRNISGSLILLQTRVNILLQVSKENNRTRPHTRAEIPAGLASHSAVYLLTTRFLLKMFSFNIYTEAGCKNDCRGHSRPPPRVTWGSWMWPPPLVALACAPIRWWLLSVPPSAGGSCLCLEYVFKALLAPQSTRLNNFTNTRYFYCAIGVGRCITNSVLSAKYQLTQPPLNNKKQNVVYYIDTLESYSEFANVCFIELRKICTYISKMYEN